MGLRSFPTASSVSRQILCGVTLCISATAVTQADVTLDGSLGPAGPLSGPAYTIPDTVGRTVGTNLFHSFSTFSLDASESATFTGPATITNVLSRVTGGEQSEINGLLRSDIGTADFFLVNPAGVLFGAAATVDVPGSFYVSTADYVRLSDGVRFNALPGPADATLSVASPAAFGFLAAPTGRVEVVGNGSILTPGSDISVDTGETISMVAGGIEIKHGNLFGLDVGSKVRAPGGEIALVGVSSSGEVGIDGSDLGAATGGDVYITNPVVFGGDTAVDVSGPGGRFDSYSWRTGRDCGCRRSCYEHRAGR